MAETAKVKPDILYFEALMLNIREGKIRIPDFQREFVWDISQIISLLDSIYNHFPIGSLLFWETSAEIQAYRRIGEIELRQDSTRGIDYVLDGQQRLTSLFASLEQASIAHRVNGKKVTKSIQIYFDLDEQQFLPNPFGPEDEKPIYRRITLAPLPSSDSYFEFLDRYLQWVDQTQPTKKQSQKWLQQWPDISESRSKVLHAQTGDMGLIVEREQHWILTDHGRGQIGNRSLEDMVGLLLDTFAYFDLLLPEIIYQDPADVRDVSTYLSENIDDLVKPYNVRDRFRWLEGIGLGSFDDDKFSLNDEGRSVLKEFVNSTEIRKRDEDEREKEKEKRYFSLQQITDMNSFVDTAASLDEERRVKLKKVLSRFTSYPFSVIYVIGQPIETACEIFERINNSGKVLNVVDLMVAKSWSQNFNLRERLNEFREELKVENYDGIPDITVIQCLSAIVAKGIRRKDILNIERGAVEEHWKPTLENIRLAIDFLKSNVKVTHAKILPFNAIIVPLAYYFSIGDPKKLDSQRRAELERWFWKVSASNRYDQGLENKVAEDLTDMGNLAEGKDVSFDYLAAPLTAKRIADQKLNLGSAFCKTLLCVLNHKTPLEFKDSTPVKLASFSKFNSAELHHIFPKAYLQREDKINFVQKDSMANIALARASANKEYSSKPPSKYLQECENENLDKVLQSHLIKDGNLSGLFEDDFAKFVDYRSAQMLKETRRLTGDMTEIELDMEEGDLECIEQFELKLRKVLHAKISNSCPNYWQEIITPELREKLEDRIGAWIVATPGRSRSSVREVDFLQFFEYFKVIKQNWPIFSDIFRSRSDLEHHFKVIAEFRNSVAHSREVDVVNRQLAIGAIGWFEKAFDVANE